MPPAGLQGGSTFTYYTYVFPKLHTPGQLPWHCLCALVVIPTSFSKFKSQRARGKGLSILSLLEDSEMALECVPLSRSLHIKGVREGLPSK